MYVMRNDQKRLLDEYMELGTPQEIRERLNKPPSPYPEPPIPWSEPAPADNEVTDAQKPLLIGGNWANDGDFLRLHGRYDPFYRPVSTPVSDERNTALKSLIKGFAPKPTSGLLEEE